MKASNPLPWMTPFLCASLAAVEARPGPAGPPAALPRLVLATYRCDFQGDARRPGAAAGVRGAGGASALTHHPWESEGPWFSGERAAWHRSQLALMQGAGIDVALPVLGESAAAGRRAPRTLAALVQALKELRAVPSPLPGRQEFPQIALAVDLRTLARRTGGSVDLKDPAAHRALYGMLRDQALRLPPEFRATVQLPDATGSEAASTPRGAACLVRLTGADAARDLDASFATYCNRRFATDFGTGLAWIGTPEMRAKVPGLAAYASPTGAAGPARPEAGGRVATVSLGPGFENALAGGDGSARSRANGSSYINDWRVTLETDPRWIFLDSWNDFARGSELAPSLEYGLQFRDLTRGATMQFKATPAALPLAGAVLRATAPRVVQPGTLYQAEVTVKNEGSADWHAFSAISLSYRWLRDGQPFGDVTPATPLAQPQGEIRAYPLAVAPPLQGGKPLAPGRYELEIGLVRRSAAGETWLAEAAQATFRAPVEVGAAPPLRPYWVRSTMPASARAGLAYRATVTARNDGSAAWRPEAGAALGFRWRRPGAGEQDEVVVEAKQAPLAEPVGPGRLLAMTVDVPLTDAQGRPLPLSGASPAGDWVLEWDLWDGGQWASAAGVPGLREAVEVVDRDPGASFVGCNLPAELVAGRTETVTLALRNLGPETWKAGRDAIAVHWYYMDGSEASWSDTRLPLPVTVEPYSEVTVRLPAGGPARRGGSRVAQAPAESAGAERVERVIQDTVLREVPVRVPDYSGPMYCVFELVHDGQPASTAPASKGTDLLVVPVNVFSPAYMPLPLTPFFDVDGISADLNRPDGNVDGRGNSLPAEQLPPYVSRPAVGTGPSASPIYPCGLWLRTLGAPGSDRVTFLYPPKEDRARNMIACRGQRLPLLAGPRAAVHLLALATEENVTADFRLHYEDGTNETRPVSLTHFTDAPRHGEHAAFVTAHRHTPGGDDLLSRCYLNHYALPANPRKGLAGLELPNNPAVKVLAITLGAAAQGKPSAGP